MKKKLATLFAAFFICLLLGGQTSQNTGKPVVEIFADFHYNTSKDTSKTGFGINRAYFGYAYNFDTNFLATLIVDIGTPDDLAPGSKPRRYAHFREASIGYTKGNLLMTLGITGTKIFNYQQRFWGKRYLAKPYQSINGYGFIADLGFVAEYKVNDKLNLDLTLMNGEGYSDIQRDNSLKPSLGCTFTPTKSLAFRVYSDLMKTKGIWQSTVVGFAGFKNERITIGGEACYKSNIDLIEGHHAWGFSGTCGVTVFKKTEVFARYDNALSGVVYGDGPSWHLPYDGQFIISGLQYTFNTVVKIALDYQTFIPTDISKSTTGMIYLNSIFKF